MSYPRAAGLVWMTCWKSHDGPAQASQTGPYSRWVPFLEAIHTPPVCHDLPMLSEGGRRMMNLRRAWRESGPAIDCRFSGKGEGQGVSCYSHGWSGVYHDLMWGNHGDRRCPTYPLAAWTLRRHEDAA